MKETDNIFDGLNLDFLSKIPPIGSDAEVEVIEPKTKAQKEEDKKEAAKAKDIKEEDLEETDTIKEVESINDLLKESDTEETEEETEAADTTEEVVEEPVTKVWADWAAEKGLIEYKPEEFEDSDAFLVKKFEEQ